MEPTSWQQISDQQFWEDSLSINSQANFLQSFSFGNFHEKLGNKVWRFGRIRDKRIVSFAQVIKLKTKFSSFFYLPWGPILDNQEDLKELTKLLAELGRREKINFIRFDSRAKLINAKAFNLKINSEFTQPSCSLILDLTKSFEEIRTGLSESTRYNVGWVERQGVKVTTSEEPDDINVFIELLKQTAHRHKFNLYQNLDYYRQQFLAFAENKLAKLFITWAPDELGKEALAAAIVIYYGEVVTYLHAASSSKHPKLRAPYLMQWKIIEDAKNSGFSTYDFWGIAKDDSPKDPWAGVTSFKKSFGGEKISYHTPYDLVLSPVYYFDTFIEKVRKPVKKLFLR